MRDDAVTNAVTPRIAPMLAMLEPTAFPKANSGWPPAAANGETTISGADAPNPMTSIPTKSAGIPRYRVSAAAPSTNRSSLHTSTARPMTVARIARITAGPYPGPCAKRPHPREGFSPQTRDSQPTVP